MAKQTRKLREATGKAVVVLTGNIGDHGADICCWDSDLGGYPTFAEAVFSTSIGDNPNRLVIATAGGSDYFMDAEMKCPFPKEILPIPIPRTGALVGYSVKTDRAVDAAYLKARGARFEFGEDGTR